VDLVHDDIVLRVIAGVCAGTELCADGDLGGEADDGDADAVGDEVGYCFVDVAGVAGE
jgi:hypothetical protein